MNRPVLAVNRRTESGGFAAFEPGWLGVQEFEALVEEVRVAANEAKGAASGNVRCGSFAGVGAPSIAVKADARATARKLTFELPLRVGS